LYKSATQQKLNGSISLCNKYLLLVSDQQGLGDKSAFAKAMAEKQKGPPFPMILYIDGLGNI